ncbi:MAG TPA: L-histidine N(alpha)-methyltransferase [Candidatus Acidoferrum sp.]|jgi:dimethylhistidine N-methyltransferase|nr:L-histidine N(alpha)-methyltransferase [Candidatus Acidoferrum sp.]
MPKAAMQTRSSPSSLISLFALEVSAGLAKPGQKELPSKYLYDSVGSALFEVICALPEYGLTRAEERLLQLHSREIVDQLPRPVVVAELGSGTGRKTRLLLEALSRWQSTWYHPIEISPSALAVLRRELRDINSISIVGFEREYLDGLREVAARRAPGEHLLVLFLGSTIGNFDGAAGSDFLLDLRHILRPGDSLLLGTDMLKPVQTLIDAYDDPIGVTAAFNLNLLGRINRELGAGFNLHQFEHLALFNELTHSVEMHLRSRSKQKVAIPEASISVHFEKEETIWTESSHKYSQDELVSLAHHSGFHRQAQWMDQTWGFAENLWIAE